MVIERRRISVTADWALRGKTPRDHGYRLLGWSNGIIGRHNFDEALDRFSPGTLGEHELPQVTLSYLWSNQLGKDYLAVAIHELAEGGYADADGRNVVFTSYFCVPYRELRSDAISYQTMYEAFRAVPLLARGSGAPIPIELKVSRPSVHHDDDFVLWVAALLLTGRPVCVLDADRVSMSDRLRFIDSVMSLLPYGMRSRMAASTWASSTYPGHKFRLFFSNTPRDADDRDHIVLWGRTDRMPDLREQPYASQYLAWLRDRVRQPMAQLAEQTDQFGFSYTDVLKVLELLDIPDRHSSDMWWKPTPQDTSPEIKTAEGLIVSCAGHIDSGNLGGLKSDLEALQGCIPVRDEDERKRCHEAIGAHRLLGPHPGIGKLEAQLCDVLLRLAFGLPLTYQGYCQVERRLGNPADEPPHQSLLEAISRGGLTEPSVSAVVLWHLRDTKRLRDRFSTDAAIGELIELIATPLRLCPHHARIVGNVIRRVCDASGRFDLARLRLALRKHGYLAPTLRRLHPDDPQYQMEALRDLLTATHGSKLSRDQAAEILGGTGCAPTEALLLAVVLLLKDPDDASLAVPEYLRGLVWQARLEPDTRTKLQELMLGTDQGPDSRTVPSFPGLDQPAPRTDMEWLRGLREEGQLTERTRGLRAFRQRFRTWRQDSLVRKYDRRNP